MKPHAASFASSPCGWGLWGGKSLWACQGLVKLGLISRENSGFQGLGLGQEFPVPATLCHLHRHLTWLRLSYDKGPSDVSIQLERTEGTWEMRNSLKLLCWQSQRAPEIILCLPPGPAWGWQRQRDASSLAQGSGRRLTQGRPGEERRDVLLCLISQLWTSTLQPLAGAQDTKLSFSLWFLWIAND